MEVNTAARGRAVERVKGRGRGRVGGREGEREVERGRERGRVRWMGSDKGRESERKSEGFVFSSKFFILFASFDTISLLFHATVMYTVYAVHVLLKKSEKFCFNGIFG